LARYAAALVNHDQHHGRERTVREFLGEFRGLSGSASQKRVLDESGLARLRLAVLFNDGSADMARFEALLEAMCRHTRPVKPKDLGVIGSEHWREYCGALGGPTGTFHYRCIAGEDELGAPNVVEGGCAAE
jgi:hypothetical protein